eukprot:352541-Chlamydomonas_euryale.AAC.2
MDVHHQRCSKTKYDLHPLCHRALVRACTSSLPSPRQPHERRQVAAISFKNLVKKYWEPASPGQPCLREEDRAVVRENLLEALIRSPHMVQLQASGARRGDGEARARGKGAAGAF